MKLQIEDTFLENIRAVRNTIEIINQKKEITPKYYIPSSVQYIFGETLRIKIPNV
jgi:hypothetical protein